MKSRVCLHLLLLIWNPKGFLSVDERTTRANHYISSQTCFHSVQLRVPSTQLVLLPALHSPHS